VTFRAKHGIEEDTAESHLGTALVAEGSSVTSHRVRTGDRAVRRKEQEDAAQVSSQFSKRPG